MATVSLKQAANCLSEIDICIDQMVKDVKAFLQTDISMTGPQGTVSHKTWVSASLLANGVRSLDAKF